MISYLSQKVYESSLKESFALTNIVALISTSTSLTMSSRLTDSFHS